MITLLPLQPHAHTDSETISSDNVPHYVQHNTEQCSGKRTRNCQNDRFDRIHTVKIWNRFYQIRRSNGPHFSEAAQSPRRQMQKIHMAPARYNTSHQHCDHFPIGNTTAAIGVPKSAENAALILARMMIFLSLSFKCRYFAHTFPTLAPN